MLQSRGVSSRLPPLCLHDLPRNQNGPPVLLAPRISPSTGDGDALAHVRGRLAPLSPSNTASVMKNADGNTCVELSLASSPTMPVMRRLQLSPLSAEKVAEPSSDRDSITMCPESRRLLPSLDHCVAANRPLGEADEQPPCKRPAFTPSPSARGLPLAGPHALGDLGCLQESSRPNVGAASALSP